MVIYIVLASILVPLLATAVSFISPNDRIRKTYGSVFAILLLLFTLALFGLFLVYRGASGLAFSYNIQHVSLVVRFVNAGLMLAVMIRMLSLRPRRIFTAVLCGVQIVVLFVMEAFVMTKLGGTVVYVDLITVVSLATVQLMGAIAVFATLTGQRGQKDNAHISYVYLTVLMATCAILSDNAVWLFFFWQAAYLVDYMAANRAFPDIAGRKTANLLNANLIAGIAMAAGLILVYRSDATSLLSEIAARSGAPEGGNLLFSYGFGFLIVAVLLRLGMVPFSRVYDSVTGGRGEPNFPFLMTFFAAGVPGVYMIMRLAPVLEDSLMGDIVSALASMIFAAAAFMLMFRAGRQKTQFWTRVSGVASVFALATLGDPGLYTLAVALMVMNAAWLAAWKSSHVATDTGDGRTARLAGFVRNIALPCLAAGAIVAKLFAVELSSGHLLTVVLLVIGCAFEGAGQARRLAESLRAGPVAVKVRELFRRPGNMRATMLVSAFAFGALSLGLPFLLMGTLLPYAASVFSAPAALLPHWSGIWIVNADGVAIGGFRTTIAAALVAAGSLATFLAVYRTRKPVWRSEPFLCGVNAPPETEAGNASPREPRFLGASDEIVETLPDRPPEAKLPVYVDYAAWIFILAIFGVLIK